MDNIFNISITDFLNPYKIKIIDGIAGAGKSSIIHNFFKEKNISYMRCTSTNRLKRDAENAIKYRVIQLQADFSPMKREYSIRVKKI